MSLPSAIGLPNEMMLGNLDYSLPPDAKSYSLKIQPSNLSTIVSPIYTATASSHLDLPFPSQNIIFDIPCGNSPSVFLDNRFSTISFKATISVVNHGSSAIITSGYLRSNANSFFDRMYITSQNGQIIEDLNEYGLVNDLLINLQMSNSVRDGIALQYGFQSSNGIDSQGHSIGIFTGNTLEANEKENHSYAVPLLSGCIGVTADKMCNVGRTSKMQLCLQTTQTLPLSILTGTASTAGTFQVTLSDFSLDLEYIDIGLSALKMLDATLIDGKSYIHGVSYRVSTATLPASITGSTSLLAGIRASSVKSVFAKFVEAGVSITTSCNKQYDGKNPMISNIQFNIGGTKYPQTNLNPLLHPASVFRNLQMAIGSFNNSQFTSSIPPEMFCKLSAGGTASLFTSATQDYNWNLYSSSERQCQFVVGQNLEVVAKRGLLSGLNCTSAPVFVEMNIQSAPTNAHTMYVIAMVDTILIHDVNSGDISCRL